ncbi:MAG: GNAT family N-acetyltransferase [Lachnospiraceae bacterium]|nr:GNAT family N-acetyltransferase [Lachnospiraceae bacterium]
MRKALTNKEIYEITEEFYSKLIGTELKGISDGIHFVCSEERDKEVKGLGAKYTIIIFVKGEALIVVYSPKHAGFIETLKGQDKDTIIRAVSDKYKLLQMHYMIFGGEIITDYGKARVLKAEDYPMYEEFFRITEPEADPTGWLQEYFEEKAAKEYFVGVVDNGKLLAVCDAPDVPFMEDMIQHTGIMTLKSERRKGYATNAAAYAAHHLIEIGVCPQWECTVKNEASYNLSKHIGYKDYGLAYILEE